MKILKSLLIFSMLLSSPMVYTAKATWKMRLKEKQELRRIRKEEKRLEKLQREENGETTGCTPRKIREAAAGIGTVLTSVAGVVVTILQFFLRK